MVLPDRNIVANQADSPVGGIAGSKRRKTNLPLDELKRQAYSFSDLSKYSFRNRIIIRATDLFFFVLIYLIARTIRWEVRGLCNLKAITEAGRVPIYTSWHCCIFTATWFWRNRGIVVMSSPSRDGEFTGRIIKRFGFGTARGSASRRAGPALAEMAGFLDNGIPVGFTIDGPKGPAFIAKGGAVTLARHSGQAILPFHIVTKRRVQLRSWDKMEIPLPFTRGLTLIAEPIYVSRGADKQELEAIQAALQVSLDDLCRKADEWRKN